nr:calcium/proton exchanger [Tanacetum cinerariifolium]
MADDGNESSNAYFSSDEEDLSYVDFHTEVDDNVIIKNVTTNDPFLNKLCPDSAHFLNVVDEPVFANDEIVVEDSENIDPKFNVKFGVTYIRHDLNQNWKKMEPVLGIRDVEVGICAGYDSMKKRLMKVQVSLQRLQLKPLPLLIADPFIPTLKIKTDIREKFLINVSLRQCKRAKQRALFDYEGGLKEHYGRLWEYRQAILDSNLGSTCRLDDEETESGHYYFRRIYVCFKGVKKTQESVAANMSNRGEIGFRLGDYEAEELGKQLAEPIVAVTPSVEPTASATHITPSVEPTASATHSTDKGKQVANHKAKRKDLKKAQTSSKEGAGNQRIIFHKNRGSSERIFNQKMKKSGFGPNGEGSTPDKAFSLT